MAFATEIVGLSWTLLINALVHSMPALASPASDCPSIPSSYTWQHPPHTRSRITHLRCPQGCCQEGYPVNSDDGHPQIVPQDAATGLHIIARHCKREHCVVVAFYQGLKERGVAK